METLLINLKSDSDRNIFTSLANRLQLKSRILSDDDKEDYGLLKTMLEEQTGEYVDKKTVMKALRK
jgi:hypothetical protein